MLPAENIVSQLDQLTPESFNKLFQLMSTRQVQTLTADLQHVKDALMKQDEKIDQLELLHTDLAKKQYHIQNRLGSVEFLSPSLLGQRNIPSFKAQRMNKLLKYANIINKYNTPYAKWLNRKDVVQESKATYNGKEIISYHYNVTKVWDEIHDRLKADGVYHKFIACKNKTEIDELIDSLEI